MSECNEDNTEDNPITKFARPTQAMKTLLPSSNVKMVAGIVPSETHGPANRGALQEPTGYVLTGVAQSAWKSGHRLG